jgi:hypothetical protein
MAVKISRCVSKPWTLQVSQRKRQCRRNKRRWVRGCVFTLRLSAASTGARNSASMSDVLFLKQSVSVLSAFLPFLFRSLVAGESMEVVFKMRPKSSFANLFLF